MTFWKSLIDWFDSSNSATNHEYTSSIESMSEINPATGLPMIGDGMSGVDIGGSPFGTDMHQSSFSSPFDDPFSGL
jgi:hypothetical protein